MRRATSPVGKEGLCVGDAQGFALWWLSCGRVPCLCRRSRRHRNRRMAERRVPPPCLSAARTQGNLSNRMCLGNRKRLSSWRTLVPAEMRAVPISWRVMPEKRWLLPGTAPRHWRVRLTRRARCRLHARASRHPCWWGRAARGGIARAAEGCVAADRACRSMYAWRLLRV